MRTKSFKVRFNLGRGKNYMKWKVQHPDGKTEYHHPTDVQLVMTECTLKNYAKTAKKIHEGGEKVVCAWVLCKSVQIRTEDFRSDNEFPVKYNPRKAPNWMLANGSNADNKKFDEIFSVDYGLYVQQN